MWDRWKNKLSDLFNKEYSDDIDEEVKSNNKREIETKMMYQYPTKPPCRFPLIPDNMEERETSNTPAYKRRTNENRQRNEQTDKAETRQGEERKVPEKKRPFVPSPIISPIHGYQKRKETKEIEDIPTFVRKQREIINEEIGQEPEIHIPEKLPINIKDEVEVKEAVIVEAFPHAEEVKNTEKPSENDRQIMDTHNESISVQSDEQSNIQPKQSKRKHRSNKGKRKQHNNQDQRQEEQSPFNVIMTPRDKKSLFDKRKAQMTSTKTHQEPTNTVQQQEAPFPYHLLNDPEIKSNEDRIWVEDQQELLEETLKHFKVKAKVVNATQGPSVTRFEVQPELGVKVSSVRNLNDDIKLNMSAKDIRIEAPIPGKNTIGIEIPNLKSQVVGLQEIFETKTFKNSESPLTIGLGLTVEGLPLITNISKMPHGLIAGATGSGKSVCINTILISLLYKASHKDVKFLLIDPKMVELAPYNGIPHLVAPVITDVKAATAALKWAVSEMEERYVKFVQEGARDIAGYNDKMIKQNRLEEKMPFMVIVIDELADLMMAAPQDVEDAICRIAQKARACGMHLLLATQRPSVDVITGLIKANIPTRIAFSVSSQVDSRTIIDTNGADRLLGKGDMLFVENGSGKSIRLQGAFVSDEEIGRVTNHARSIAPPQYIFEQDQLLQQIEEDEDEDELLEEAIQFVLKQNRASTSLLQRQFRIGYNRAARLIDTIENRGIISGQNGSKARDVLLSEAQLEEMY